MSNDWSGLNLSSKASTASSTDDGDAPLDLCMKASSDSKAVDFSNAGGNSGPSSTNSLQSLSSITAALGSGSGNDRMGKQTSPNGRGVSHIRIDA